MVFSGVDVHPFPTTLDAGILSSTGVGAAGTTSPGAIPGKSSFQKRSTLAPKQMVSGSASVFVLTLDVLLVVVVVVLLTLKRKVPSTNP